MNRYKQVKILDVPFLHATLKETIDLLTESVKKNEKAQVITANPEIVMLGREKESYMDLLKKASVITPDGIGVVLASRWIGKPLPERVAGYELLHALMAKANEFGWKYILVGASPQSCEGAARELQRLYPSASYTGHFDGYFSNSDEIKIIEHIKDAKPQLLFVGLGAPRQEEWIAKHFTELPINIAMGVGGSFDVLSGTVKRAPLIWQKLYIEWLYRLLSQPKRWRRQMLLPKFAFTVLWNRFVLRKD